MQTTFAQMILDAERKMCEKCGEWVPSRLEKEQAVQPIADMLAGMPYQDAKAFVMATWNKHCSLHWICVALHREMIQK